LGFESGPLNNNQFFTFDQQLCRPDKPRECEPSE
jgi:hypothetical protein